MMSASLALAFALLLILEGLLPLLAPARWRAMFRRVVRSAFLD